MRRRRDGGGADANLHEALPRRGFADAVAQRDLEEAMERTIAGLERFRQCRLSRAYYCRVSRNVATTAELPTQDPRARYPSPITALITCRMA